MLSIRDYGKKNGITYESARRWVARYEKALKGHITKENRTRFLDDYAVKLLDEKRAASPEAVAVIEDQKEVDALRKQIDELNQKVQDLEDKLDKKNEEINSANNDTKQVFAKYFQIQDKYNALLEKITMTPTTRAAEEAEDVPEQKEDQKTPQSSIPNDKVDNSTIQKEKPIRRSFFARLKAAFKDN